MALASDEACCKRCKTISLHTDMVDGYCRRCARYPREVRCARCHKTVPRISMIGGRCPQCITVTREHVCGDCGKTFTTTARHARKRLYCDECVRIHHKAAIHHKALANSERHKKYGLDEHHVQAMYERQAGKCAICLQAFDLEELYIDHEHAIGFVRGLLCPPCNAGLGQFRDDIARLKRAIKYLEHPPAQDAFATTEQLLLL